MLLRLYHMRRHVYDFNWTFESSRNEKWLMAISVPAEHQGCNQHPWSCKIQHCKEVSRVVLLYFRILKSILVERMLYSLDLDSPLINFFFCCLKLFWLQLFFRTLERTLVFILVGRITTFSRILLNLGCINSHVSVPWLVTDSLISNPSMIEIHGMYRRLLGLDKEIVGEVLREYASVKLSYVSSMDRFLRLTCAVSWSVKNPTGWTPNFIRHSSHFVTDSNPKVSNHFNRYTFRNGFALFWFSCSSY